MTVHSQLLSVLWAIKKYCTVSPIFRFESTEVSVGEGAQAVDVCVSIIGDCQQFEGLTIRLVPIPGAGPSGASSSECACCDDNLQDS